MLSQYIFYVKIKSFYIIYDTCCSQKLENDVKIQHWCCHKYIKMLDMPQSFFDDSNVSNDCTKFQVHKKCLITFLSWPICLKKTLRIYGRCTFSLGCHGNHLSLIWKMKNLTKGAWDDFDNWQKIFSVLKEEKSEI